MHMTANTFATLRWKHSLRWHRTRHGKMVTWDHCETLLISSWQCSLYTGERKQSPKDDERSTCVFLSPHNLLEPQGSWLIWNDDCGLPGGIALTCLRLVNPQKWEKFGSCPQVPCIHHLQNGLHSWTNQHLSNKKKVSQKTKHTFSDSNRKLDAFHSKLRHV